MKDHQSRILRFASKITKRGRLVLHIGAPKTGTTSLQKALTHSKPALRVHGINVLFIDDYASRELAEYFGLLNMGYFENLGLPSLHAINERFGSFRSIAERRLFSSGFRHKTTLISSEHLYLRFSNKEFIKIFIDFLRPHFQEIRVAVYTREQHAFLRGLYWEYLKSGGDLDITTYEKTSVPPHWYPEASISNWSAIVGKNCVDVRSYDDLKGNDICIDFSSEILGLDDFSLSESRPKQEPERLNRSPTDEDFEKLRIFNVENPRDSSSEGDLRKSHQRRSLFVRSLEKND